MKYLIHGLFVCMLVLAIPAHGQEVNISIDRPDRVNAGEEFTVTITIDKGNLTDYSRFSQDLPEGLSASNVSSPNADFSFDNQRVRIIWLKMPDAERLQVSYRVMVDPRLKGSFSMGGVFAYVVDGNGEGGKQDDQNETDPIGTNLRHAAIISKRIVRRRDFW